MKEDVYGKRCAVLLLLSVFGLLAWGASLLLAAYALLIVSKRAVEVSSAGEFAMWGGGGALLMGSIACLLWGFIPWGRARPKHLFELARDQLPEFWAILAKLDAHNPLNVPKRVVVVEDANAYASYHGGIPGVLKNESKLGVGLPLLYALSLEELSRVLAHELAHFEDRLGMAACVLSFEIEGMINRATHGFSLWIRARIVDTQKVTIWRVASLCYFALCAIPLRLVFDWLVPLIAEARAGLYEEMEIRADMKVASREGVSRDKVEAVRRLVERLGSSAAEPDGAGKRCVDVKRLCRESAVRLGREEPKHQTDSRLAWGQLDRLVES